MSSAASTEKYKAPRSSAGATRSSASPAAAGGSGSSAPAGSPAASAAAGQEVDAEWLAQHNAAMFTWFETAEAEVRTKGGVSTPAPGILTGVRLQFVDTYDPARDVSSTRGKAAEGSTVAVGGQ